MSGITKQTVLDQIEKLLSKFIFFKVAENLASKHVREVDANPDAVETCIDNIVASDDDLSQFRYHDYDKLLKESGILLQRADEDRQNWNKYALENAKLSIELIRLKSKVEVLQIQLTNEHFEFMNHDAERRYKIEQSRLEQARTKLQNAKDTSSYFKERVRKHRRRYRRYAWRDNKGIGVNLSHQHSAEDRVKATELQEILNHKEAATQKLISDSAKQRWEHEKTALEHKLAEISAEIQAIDHHVNLTANGILNYRKIMDPLSERITVDLAQVLIRKQVIDSGIKSIYGQKLFAQAGANAELTMLDASISWLRLTTNNLAPYLKRKQSTSIVVEFSDRYRVRRSGKEFVFVVGEAQGEASPGPSIKLPASARCVQIKGLSVFKSMGVFDPIELRVTPPVLSSYRTLDNELVEVEQSELRCDVSKNSNDAANEIFGADLLNNISPVGEWTVEQLSSPQLDTNASSLLIHIEYLTVAQP